MKAEQAATLKRLAKAAYEEARRIAANIPSCRNCYVLILPGPVGPNDNRAGLIVADLHTLLGIARLVANPSKPIRRVAIHVA
jgi:hypothetical protein